MSEILNKNKGFTLVEFLIAAALAAIVIFGTFTYYLSQQNLNNAQSRKSQLERSLRLAMDVMIEDIRKAGYDPDSSGLFGLTISEASKIAYTLDEDSDGVVDDGEEYRFKLDGAVLVYIRDANEGEPDSNFTWQSVNVSPVEFNSLQFAYSDTSQPPDGVVDTVDITLTGRIKLPLKSEVYETRVLIGKVILRNKI